MNCGIYTLCELKKMSQIRSWPILGLAHQCALKPFVFSYQLVPFPTGREEVYWEHVVRTLSSGDRITLYTILYPFFFAALVLTIFSGVHLGNMESVLWVFSSTGSWFPLTIRNSASLSVSHMNKPGLTGRVFCTGTHCFWCSWLPKIKVCFKYSRKFNYLKDVL